MEQRKLIQHGMSSLTVALPLRWAKDRGLSKGKSIFIEEEGNKLVISTDESIKIGKISVDITDLDRTSIILYIHSLYRYGYDEIEVKFNKFTARHHRLEKDITVSSILHYIVNRLVGVEIIEQTNNKVLIKYLTKESEEDFRIVLRRIFILLEEAVESLLEGIKKKDMDIVKTIEEKHDNITKFISYCLRLLNKYGYPDVKKTCFYYHVIASLDKIIDIIKYNARDVLDYKNKFNEDTIEIWEDANESLKLYYNFFYNFDLKKADELDEKRNHVKKSIKRKLDSIPSYELVLLMRMEELLELILDLKEVRMGLEY